MLRHSRQPSHTGATQQAKQQGFGLIVAMLASEKHLPCPHDLHERLVARIARRTFKARAGPHLHTHDAQGYAQAVADRLAMSRPRLGSSLQAMVDMDGADRRQIFDVGQ